MSVASNRGRRPVDGLVELRRRQICAAAIRLFGKQGFHSTTLESVADEAKISVGLIYRYFADKEDLLYYAILEICDGYATEIPQAASQGKTALERFTLAMHAYVSVIDRHRIAAMLTYRASNALGHRRLKSIIKKELETNQLIAKMIDDCVASGEFDCADIEMFTYQAISFAHSWATEAWRFPKTLTVDEFVERGLASLLRSVVPSMHPSRGDPEPFENRRAIVDRSRATGDVTANRRR